MLTFKQVSWEGAFVFCLVSFWFRLDFKQTVISEVLPHLPHWLKPHLLNSLSPHHSHLHTSPLQLASLYVTQLPVLYVWFLQTRCVLPFTIINNLRTSFQDRSNYQPVMHFGLLVLFQKLISKTWTTFKSAATAWWGVCFEFQIREDFIWFGERKPDAVANLQL